MAPQLWIKLSCSFIYHVHEVPMMQRNDAVLPFSSLDCEINQNGATWNKIIGGSRKIPIDGRGPRGVAQREGSVTKRRAEWAKQPSRHSYFLPPLKECWPALSGSLWMWQTDRYFKVTTEKQAEQRRELSGWFSAGEILSTCSLELQGAPDCPYNLRQ